MKQIEVEWISIQNAGEKEEYDGKLSKVCRLCEKELLETEEATVCTRCLSEIEDLEEVKINEHFYGYLRFSRGVESE